MAETKLKILDSAARAFAAKGFHRATIRQIAADACVNEVTVFRYFPEKADLYWAAVDRKIRSSEVTTLLTEAVRSSETPADLVVSTSSCIRRLLRKDKDLARLLHFTFLELEDERRLLWTGLVRPLLDDVSSRLKSWMSEGRLRNMDTEKATRALFGYAISQHLVWILDESDDSESPEEQGTKADDVALFELLPR